MTRALLVRAVEGAAQALHRQASGRLPLDLARNLAAEVVTAIGLDGADVEITTGDTVETLILLALQDAEARGALTLDPAEAVALAKAAAARVLAVLQVRCGWCRGLHLGPERCSRCAGKGWVGHGPRLPSD